MSDGQGFRDEHLVAAEFRFDSCHMAAEIIRLRSAEAAAFRRGAEAMKLQVKAYCVALVLAGQRGEFGPEVDALPLPEDKR